MEEVRAVRLILSLVCLALWAGNRRQRAVIKELRSGLAMLGHLVRDSAL